MDTGQESVKRSLKTGNGSITSRLSQIFRKRNLWLNDFNTPMENSTAIKMPPSLPQATKQ